MLRLAAAVILSSQIAQSFNAPPLCCRPSPLEGFTGNRPSLVSLSRNPRVVRRSRCNKDVEMVSVRVELGTTYHQLFIPRLTKDSPAWTRQFRSCHGALKLDEDTKERVIRDCDKAFNLECGSTFWLGASDKPRSCLEKMAQQIFMHYTQQVEFDASRSGVEWWVQMRLGGDGQAEPGVMGEDITLHWDKDEELVNTIGTHMTPYVGTVTYLTNYGAPTVVLNKAAPKQAEDVEGCYGSISHGFLSYPSVGQLTLHCQLESSPRRR